MSQPIQYEWRQRSRVVGFVDLIFSGISILISIVILVLALGATEMAVEANKKDSQLSRDIQLNPEDKTAVTTVAVVMWVLTGIQILVTVLQIVAAVRLVNGTEMGREPLDALRLTRFWRTVTIVFMVINAFGAFAGGAQAVSTVIALAIRGIFLYIVIKFMGELEVAGASTGTGVVGVAPQYKI